VENPVALAVGVRTLLLADDMHHTGMGTGTSMTEAVQVSQVGGTDGGTSPSLLEQHQGRLALAAAEAEFKFTELRLDLKDCGIATDLPTEVLSLLAWADSFDLSGNSFCNIKKGTALHHMVYHAHRWKGEAFNWVSMDLTELDGAADYLHSGSMKVQETTVDIKSIKEDQEVDLSGKTFDIGDATMISSFLSRNRYANC
jgi:hypothetical protein